MNRFKRLASAVWDFFDPCGQSKYAAKCADIRLRAKGLAIEGKSHRETMAEAMMILSGQMHEHEGPYVGSLCEEASALLRDSIKSRIMALLKRLEEEIAPPAKCRHAITFARYGSDAMGWEDRLALQINDKESGKFWCVFFDDGDLESLSTEQLVADIIRVVAEMKKNANAQCGVSGVQYAEAKPV